MMTKYITTTRPNLLQFQSLKNSIGEFYLDQKRRLVDFKVFETV